MGRKDNIKSLENIEKEINGCINMVTADIQLLEMAINDELIIKKVSDIVIKRDLHRIRNRLRQLV